LSAARLSGEVVFASSTQCASWKVTAVTTLVTVATVTEPQATSHHG
jgi:hypothetical protein